MSDLPPGLDEFGKRLRQAAQADVHARARSRRPTLRSLALTVVATVLTVAAGAGAVTVIDGGQGPPIRADSGDGAGLQSPTDPGVVTASATADPAGGPPWVLRVYTNSKGEECAQVGRLRNGSFGQVQQGRFRRLPPNAPGTCGPATRPRTLLAVERHINPSRTLIFGLAAERSAIVVRNGSRSVTVTPTGLGAFVAVFAGVDDGSITIDDGTGRRRTP